ncbi:uncharacterized protein LODBEIA_P01150 [Lodderomyces beijingensis]|uniref:THO complex subunit 2 n=1 Tax=Lodderomyces beijingensis TaxID=1775926 RepID=A0ABP0ZCI3_9ASCO
MSFKYFTPEVLDQFDGAGSIEILEALDSYDVANADSETELVLLFTELILSYEDDKLKIVNIVEFLSQSIKNDEIARIFCQVLNAFPIAEKSRELLSTLSEKQSIIKPDTIASYISADLIKDADLVPKVTLTKTLNARLRDKLYTQNKFNLLHEEIEGFSKLVSELCSIFSSKDTDLQLDYVLQVIDKLIGHYKLDPNKTLSLVLEVLSCFIFSKPDCVVSLLKKSKWWPSKESNNNNNNNALSIETLSEGGSVVASHVLGMKIMAHPGSRDFSDNTTNMIAILIKEGFVSFGSIYKYIRPDDEGMRSFEEAYNSDLQEQVSKAGANALALAAPLADEDEEKPLEKKKLVETTEKQAVVEKNHRLQFLKAFAANGLYMPCIYVLSQNPFLAHLDNEIKLVLSRMFDAMLDPLYESISDFSKSELCHLATSKMTHVSRPGNKVSKEAPKLNHRISISFKVSGTDSSQSQSQSQSVLHFFNRTWSETLPKIKDFESLLKVSQEFLKFIASDLAENVPLFIKLCDVIKSFSNQEQYKEPIFHYFRNYIFPVMPLIKGNSIAIDKAFAILAEYPLEDRFSVYGELYNNLRKNDLGVKIAYSVAEKSTKDVLKRLSKENIRPMMRRLAKICFSNPLPCLLTILQQIESYDNLITLVVETARYFNAYGWDNLTVAILMRLSSDRSSSSGNGMIDRQWLQSLASFIGKICQRYPNAIDIRTILRYLLKTFYSGERTGLLVLKEMLVSMGGIRTTSDLTLKQVDMIGSGSSLQKMVYRVIDDVRCERVVSGSHLFNCFVELGAINEVVILLCTILNDLIFDRTENQLKVLASRADDISEVLKLFITMVEFFGDADVNILSIQDFHQKHGIPVEWIFDLWRTKKMDFLEQYENLASGVCPEGLAPSLFYLFWALSLHDINYSDSLYEGEIEKLEGSIRGLRNSMTINAKNSNFSRDMIDKYRIEIEENRRFIAQIPTDKEKHKESNELVSKKLRDASAEWFSSPSSEKSHKNLQNFVQFCILPRAVHSPFDAVFAARFVFKMHELGVSNYALMEALDLLFDSDVILSTLCSSTPAEVESLGFFYANLLKTLNEMTSEKEEEQEKFSKGSNLGDFDAFRNTVYHYHANLLTQVDAALSAPDYMSRSNTILLLKGLISVFPIAEDHGEEVVKIIEKVLSADAREDIRLSSGALLGLIKARTKLWLPIYDLIPMSEEEKQTVIETKARVLKEKELAEKKEKEQKEEEKRLERLAREEEQLIKKRAGAINYTSSRAPQSRPLSRSAINSSGKYEEYAVSNAKSEQAANVSTNVNLDDASSRKGDGVKIDIRTRLSQMKQEDRARARSEEPPEVRAKVVIKGESRQDEGKGEGKDPEADVEMKDGSHPRNEDNSADVVNEETTVNGDKDVKDKDDKGDGSAMEGAPEKAEETEAMSVEEETEGYDVAEKMEERKGKPGIKGHEGTEATASIENTKQEEEEEKEQTEEKKEKNDAGKSYGQSSNGVDYDHDHDQEKKSAHDDVQATKRTPLPPQSETVRAASSSSTSTSSATNLAQARPPLPPQSSVVHESDASSTSAARRPLPPQKQLLGKNEIPRAQPRGKYPIAANFPTHQTDPSIPPPPSTPPIPANPRRSTFGSGNHRNSFHDRDPGGPRGRAHDGWRRQDKAHQPSPARNEAKTVDADDSRPKMRGATYDNRSPPARGPGGGGDDSGQRQFDNKRRSDGHNGRAGYKKRTRY